ncbi:MAG: VanZ family protein [Thermodesulfobacteriota bacterium]
MNRSSNQFQLPGLVNKSIFTIWICSLAVIVFFSLEPSLTTQTRHLDKAIHLLSYLWLAMLLMICLRSNKWLLLAPVSLIVLGIGLEIIQAYIPGRFFSVPDMISNSLGVVAGALLGRKIKSLLARVLAESKKLEARSKK